MFINDKLLVFIEDFLNSDNTKVMQIEVKLLESMVIQNLCRNRGQIWADFQGYGGLPL